MARTYVAADRATQLIGAVRQLRGRPFRDSAGFEHVGAVGPVPLTESLHIQFASIGTTLARAFNLRGLFGVDVVVSRGRVWTLEVNPRYTASVEILERALAWQSLAAQCAACEGQPMPAPTQVLAACWGKAVIYADQATAVSAAFCEWVDGQNRRHVQPRFLDLPQPGTSCERGQPILTVMAAGASADAAEHRLRQAAAAVREQLGATGATGSAGSAGSAGADVPQD